MTIQRLIVSFSFVVLASGLLLSCSKPEAQFVRPGEAEESERLPGDVPPIVQATAKDICNRLGGAVVVGWYWDIEDKGWECRLHGLARPAELDITADGKFSELEIFYEFAEVQEALPEVAKKIKQMCQSDAEPFIELSLRRLERLDSLPTLKEAWSLSGVVLEFQCKSGADYELDARGLHIDRARDDS